VGDDFRVRLRFELDTVLRCQPLTDFLIVLDDPVVDDGYRLLFVQMRMGVDISDQTTVGELAQMWYTLEKKGNKYTIYVDGERVDYGTLEDHSSDDEGRIVVVNESGMLF
jgi:hypothetical protein